MEHEIQYRQCASSIRGIVGFPLKHKFEQADNIMQSLVNLSPRRLDVLLHACKHALAKRLFLFFADRYQHAWRNKIEPKNYDLGAGKRSVIKGGSFNKAYQITVPEALSAISA